MIDFYEYWLSSFPRQCVNREHNDWHFPCDDRHILVLAVAMIGHIHIRAYTIYLRDDSWSNIDAGPHFVITATGDALQSGRDRVGSCENSLSG